MSKKKLFRGITVAGIAAAFLGTALIPGIAAPKSASAVDDLKPIITTSDTTWKYNETNTDPAAGAADRLVWAKDGFTIPAEWKSAKGAFGFKQRGTPPRRIESDNADGKTWTTRLASAPTADGKENTKTYHFVTDVTLTKAQLDGADSFNAELTVDDAAQVFVNGVKVGGVVDEKVEAAPEAQRNLMYAGASNGAPVDAKISIPK
ncbi:MAG: hypothetical protein Q4C71_02420, partial [Microbacteriaceae bacterium]|nr:hypothetical protein [Microbacteriaceae bacterium]